jgi:hypothetical protein
MSLRRKNGYLARATIYRKLCLFWLCSHEKLQQREKRELNLKDKEVNTNDKPPENDVAEFNVDGLAVACGRTN